MSDIRTLSDIRSAIARRAKFDLTAERIVDLDEKINSFYLHLQFKKAYSWSGATRTLKLRAKYTTGTVSVTNGSDIITGSSTVWSENSHLFSRMLISGSNTPFKIIRVGSTTSITLDAPWTGSTGSALTYQLYRDEYPLWPDYLNVRRMYLPGLQKWLDPVSPEEIDKRRFQWPARGGVPSSYSILGVGVYTEKTWATFNVDFDFFEDALTDQPRNHVLVLHPAILTQDRIAEVRISRLLPPLFEDTDEPLVPLQTRRVLVYGPLMEHFAQGRDPVMKREWEASYNALAGQMESDVERTDDELIWQVDRTQHRRYPSMVETHELDSDE